jgi:hypothetical protein
MTKHKFHYVFVLLCLPIIAWGGQVCERKILLVDGQYTAPAGWHVTFIKAQPGKQKLLFLMSTFNFDHKNNENNFRISCFYKAPDDLTQLEVTTDLDNIQPPSTWKALDDKSTYCFPIKPVNPDDCPFEVKTKISRLFQFWNKLHLLPSLALRLFHHNSSSVENI